MAVGSTAIMAVLLVAAVAIHYSDQLRLPGQNASLELAKAPKTREDLYNKPAAPAADQSRTAAGQGNARSGQGQGNQTKRSRIQSDGHPANGGIGGIGGDARTAAHTSGPAGNPHGGGRQQNVADSQPMTDVQRAEAKRINELLDRKDYLNDPSVKRQLVWKSYLYPGLRVFGDVREDNKSSEGRLRIVDIDFKGRSSAADTAHSAYFYAVQEGDNPRDFVYETRNVGRKGDRILKMRIYLVGERFRDASPLGIEARFFSGSYDFDTGREAASIVALRTLKLDLSYRTSRDPQPHVALDTEQRLIQDNRGIAYWAMLICDGRCEDHRRTIPSEQPHPIRVELRAAKNGETQPVTDWEQLTQLLATHSLFVCLSNENRHPRSDVRDSAPVVVMDGPGFPQQCQFPGIEYHEDQALVSVDLDRVQAAGGTTEAASSAELGTPALGPQEDRTHQPASTRPTPPQGAPDPQLAIVLTDANDHPLAEPQGTYTLTIGVLSEPRNLNGHSEILLDSNDVQDETRVSISVPGYEPIDKQLLDERLRAFRNDRQSPNRPPRLEMRIPLTRLRALADLRLVPVYRLFGGPQTEINAIRDRDCTYSVALQPHAGEPEPDREPSVALIPDGTGSNTAFRPSGQGSDRKVNAGDTLALTSVPQRRGAVCLKPSDLIEVPPFGSGPIHFRVRKSDPWLLGVLTSLDFPRSGSQDEAHYHLAKLRFWESFLTVLHDAIAERGAKGLPKLGFARLVEGSADGLARDLYLAGAKQEDPHSTAIGLSDIDHAAAEYLVMTPAEVDRVRSPKAGTASPGKLAEFLSGFAADQYVTVRGVPSTVLIVRGYDLLPMTACSDLQTLVETVGHNGDIRVVELNLVNGIPSPWAGSGTLDIEPLTDEVHQPWDGVYTCNPNKYPASQDNPLYAVEYYKLFDNPLRPQAPKEVLKLVQDALAAGGPGAMPDDTRRRMPNAAQSSPRRPLP
jgi:hypothetical protein